MKNFNDNNKQILQKRKINIAYVITITMILVLVLIYPERCMDGCTSGLKLFVKALFPTLFPFLVLCNILMYLKGGDFYGKYLGPLICRPFNVPKPCSIVILMSFLCGYPVGAKYTCSLYDNGDITYTEAESLLNIASNASPLFILGTVSITILRNTTLGILLLISNYFSCIVMGFLLRGHNKTSYNINETKTYAPSSPTLSFSKAFSMSVDDAISVTLKVGGYVIIFSVLNNLIMKSGIFIKLICTNDVLKTVISLIMSLFELTNGCMMISNISIPMFLKLGFISFAISFSGLCIILQVYSFTIKHGFSIKKYVLRKLLHGVISFLITVIMYFIRFRDVTATTITSPIIVSNPFKYIFIILLALSCLITIMIAFKKNKIKI